MKRSNDFRPLVFVIDFSSDCMILKCVILDYSSWEFHNSSITDYFRRIFIDHHGAITMLKLWEGPWWQKNWQKILWTFAQNALQWEWNFASFANGSFHNGICWGLPVQLAQFIKIHFLLHLESFKCKRKFENKFFKKSPIQPPNGVFPVYKLLFPNGSYCNGVYRALWALCCTGLQHYISSFLALIW